MRKSVFTFVLLASSLVMLSAIPLLNNNTVAMAQGYDSYSDSYYSQYPTDDKKYECRTGPFEGYNNYRYNCRIPEQLLLYCC